MGTKEKMKSHEELFEEMETLLEFEAKLLENIKELDPEYSKVVDENFWDLI